MGQNIKYDLLVLRRYQVEVKGPLFDTMIAHYLLNPEIRHGMDYMAETYLNYRTIRIEELIGPKGKNQRSMRDADPDAVKDYAAEDADITLRLKNILEKEIHENGLNQLFHEVEMHHKGTGRYGMERGEARPRGARQAVNPLQRRT